MLYLLLCCIPYSSSSGNYDKFLEEWGDPSDPPPLPPPPYEILILHKDNTYLCRCLKAEQSPGGEHQFGVVVE